MMNLTDIRASLDEVVAGTKVGRLDNQEIVVFDSTGVAVEDLAAAALVYERSERSVTGRTRFVPTE